MEKEYKFGFDIKQDLKNQQINLLEMYKALDSLFENKDIQKLIFSNQNIDTNKLLLDDEYEEYILTTIALAFYSYMFLSQCIIEECENRGEEPPLKLKKFSPKNKDD